MSDLRLIGLVAIRPLPAIVTLAHPAGELLCRLPDLESMSAPLSRSASAETGQLLPAAVCNGVA